MDPKELLEAAERELVTIPEAVRFLEEVYPAGRWYTQKLIRRIQAGDLPAARVGGKYSDGYYLVHRDHLEGLPENKRAGSQGEGQGDQVGSGEGSQAED